MKIDWNDLKATNVLINPRLPDEDKHRISALLQNLGYSGHIWVSTSGTSAISSKEQKWAALSKPALISSAQAVNLHLQSGSFDTWLHALPDYHVGGLGIWARAFLSGASVVDLKLRQGDKWCPFVFCEEGYRCSATLTALVPTQLYDLTINNLKAPPSLKASIIGGGAMNGDLYRRAKELGWNPLPSYGMTECCSQVATASLEDCSSGEMPRMKVLPHLSIALSEESKLRISGDSLLTTYAWITDEDVILSDPKVGGWFQTDDIADIDGCYLTIHGRGDDFVKIGGESVDLQRLNLLLEHCASELQLKLEAVLVAVPDKRLGHVLSLAAAIGHEKGLESVIDRYHQQTLPFERIREVVELKAIPRTSLGKVKRKALREMVCEVREGRQECNL